MYNNIDILASAKDPKVKEEVTYFNLIKLLCDAAFDPQYEDLLIAISLPIGEDMAFNEILAKIPQEVLEHIARETKEEIKIIMDQTSCLDDKEAAFCTLENVLKNSLPSDLTHEFFQKAITL